MPAVPDISPEAVAPPSGLGGTRDNVLSIRVSDAEAATVDALVEVGIMKTRSEAAAWLLSCGVAAIRPLFEKAQGIVAEMRRVRDEAQQLITQD